MALRLACRLISRTLVTKKQSYKKMTRLARMRLLPEGKETAFFGRVVYEGDKGVYV